MFTFWVDTPIKVLLLRELLVSDLFKSLFNRCSQVPFGYSVERNERVSIVFNQHSLVPSVLPVIPFVHSEIFNVNIIIIQEEIRTPTIANKAYGRLVRETNALIFQKVCNLQLARTANR